MKKEKKNQKDKVTRGSLTENERKFLASNYIARVGTCSLAADPHVVPIYYANDGSSIFFTMETRSRKFRDILEKWPREHGSG